MQTNSIFNSRLKRNVFIVTTLGSFLVPFMGSAVNVALPIIGKEFEMNTVFLSWIASSYLLAASIFLIPFGKLSDIYGRKQIFKQGVILYTITSLLNAVSWSGTSLICFRFLQGISAAMIFSSNIAMLTSVFPSQNRGRVLGINVASTYLGLSLGPVIGGFLTQYSSWQSIFYTNFFIGVILIFIVLRLKEDWKESAKEKFDLIGAIVYGLSLTCIIYGFSTLPDNKGWYLFLAGIFGTVSFIRWERSQKYPLFAFTLFKNNRTFTFSNLAALINYSATFAVSFLLSLYLHYIKNFDPKTTGEILLAQPIIMAAFSPLSGKISDKIESRIIASIGMGVCAFGLTILLFLREDTSMLYVITGLVVLGFGFALFSSPNTNAVMSSVDKKNYGIASATLATMRLTGQIISMGITTFILSAFLGQDKITIVNQSRFLNAIQIAFMVFAVLSFIGIFSSLARGKIRE